MCCLRVELPVSRPRRSSPLLDGTGIVQWLGSSRKYPAGTVPTRISSWGPIRPDRFRLDRRAWSVHLDRCCIAVNGNPALYQGFGTS